ncbi:MAG: hypothetical protein EBY32_12615 [Proteobacteria bacterium]|nr:hypothetical protein [Pseudomonadota bacterium]
MWAAPCFRGKEGVCLASNALHRGFEKFRRCTNFIFYKFKIEIVTALLMFIFLIKETKDGQARRIVVIIFSNAYAT